MHTQNLEWLVRDTNGVIGDTDSNQRRAHKTLNGLSVTLMDVPYIHTYTVVAPYLPSMWGSLRLAPIIHFIEKFFACPLPLLEHWGEPE